MVIKQLIDQWFEKWEAGDFLNLPIADDFKHTSPYGTIEGKANYLDLVAGNKDKFLDHRFILHDVITEQDHACVRYTAVQGDFSLEVSEWHFVKDGLIQEIIAYYNIEEERIRID